MGRYAIVKDGKVVNTTTWDGTTPYNPGAGASLVNIDSRPDVGIGWLYSGGVFTPPATPGPQRGTGEVKGTGMGDGATTTFTVTCPGVTLDSVPVVTPDKVSGVGYIGAEATAINTISIYYSVAPKNGAALTWNIQY